MKNNNNYSFKSTWRIWLIKQLLKKNTNKEDLLKILSEDSDQDTKNDYEDLDDNNENKLLRNIFNLSEKSVEDVMVPRAEIIAIDKNKNIKDILLLIEKESHSRMPIFEQNLDNILGFVHIKDVIKSINVTDFNINNILREVLYTAPKSPILDLLKRMRTSRIHMSLVVDEFGGVDGLVTIEDLVEEIVGDIEDEHDAEDDDAKVTIVNKKTIITNASYKIIELENFFKVKIELAKQEEIDSIGGLVFSIAHKVPKINEIFTFNNQLQFKILNANDRRIIRLEIKKII